MLSVHRPAAGAFTVCLALLAGCGGSDNETAAPTAERSAEASVAASPSASPSPSATPSTASGPAPSADLTPPGTALKFGSAAVVTTENAGKSGAVSIAPQSIKEATAEELAMLKLGGGTGYFVTYIVTNVAAPVDMGAYTPSSQELFALQDNGRPASPVAKFRAFAPCEDEDPSDLAIGASYTTCQIYLADPGFKVTSVSYARDFKSEPIVWSP